MGKAKCPSDFKGYNMGPTDGTIKCASMLEYYPRDIKSEMHRDYGGGTNTYYHIMCPDCDHQVRVRNS